MGSVLSAGSAKSKVTVKEDRGVTCSVSIFILGYRVATQQLVYDNLIQHLFKMKNCILLLKTTLNVDLKLCSLDWLLASYELCSRFCKVKLKSLIS